MGSVLSLPLSLVSAIARRGILYWLRYFVSYRYLAFRERFQKKRFDIYDFCVVGKPERNGFFVANIERILDAPSKTVCLEKHSDDAFIYGTNSMSEYLAVYIRRLQNARVQCSLILRMSDGRSYILPEEYTIQKAISEDNAFGSSRLKLQCLLPMRKWRIFFNGILQEQNENGDSSHKSIHVKFAFIWTASSEIFDFSSDLSKSMLSDYAASSPYFKSPTELIRRLNQDFDCYEQPGMILGTITFSNESEHEMYLWGCRRRFMGRNSFFRKDKITEVYGNFENGIQVHVAAIQNLEIAKRLTYGYIMRRNGFIFPIDEVRGDINESGNGEEYIKCYADKQWYDIKIKRRGTGIRFQKVLGEGSSVRTVELDVDGHNGKGLIFSGSNIGSDELLKKVDYLIHSKLSSQKEQGSQMFCISFESELCQEHKLCGGKGSSLGTLFAWSLLTNGFGVKFNVPKGLVVSTDAYKNFISGSLEESLQQFEKNIWSGKGDISSQCRKMVELVSEMDFSEHLCQSITEGLKEVFEDNISNYKFAVRSSAIGEDTEQMSAAGQMETFLGVQGIDEVLNAVKKCWASQFAFQAVEYKRGYGQILNTPMAVVIQEMVPCDVAGVVFTCDPVTGNPSFINITANWGLGESVVSASADPDTVILNRNLDNHLSIHSKQVGTKKTKIIMDGESGTKEVMVDDDSPSFCINEDMALKLGKIVVEVEKYYGNPRDIEWGFVKGDIFLFQSRPVTSLDMDSDFEIKHIFDTFQRTEKSYWSRANVGEVMPGATSPLGLDIIHRLSDTIYRRRFIRMDDGLYPQKPYFQKGITFGYSHTFINLIGGMRPMTQDKLQTACFIAATFGRLSDDKGLRKESEKCDPLNLSLLKKIAISLSFLTMAFFSGIMLRRKSKRIENFRINIENIDSIQILQQIAENYDIAVEAFSQHLNCTFSSMLWNVSLLMLLAKTRGECDNVAFSDFAYLLSTCKDVESASVPDAIQDLGIQLSKEINPDEFKKMSIEDALNWLMNNTSEAGLKFKNFLQRHGHRCLKEFDVYTDSWSTNPTHVVSMLQKFTSETAKHSTDKQFDSFSTIVSKLQVKLSFAKRLYLRWLIPNCRRGVREREQAKSLLIFAISILRKPCHKLAEMMVAEGRLPRKELLFFLCVEEIQQLIETRSPRLIAKAIRRSKVHAELDKLVFPEICDGIPKPINDQDFIPITGKGLKMIGVPVSQGIVTAPARVIMNLEEAKAIQQGDVLITYSTDIGWSPYFPLLSGVVTELGGIISHGAVVAREYGLPCVVSLHGATRVFKSGDLVILDGTNGTLQKVENETADS